MTHKSNLLKRIVAKLTENLHLLEKAARASHAEATHESSRAENKYDTRGLEAAYLAGGQARQAREILEALKLYETMKIRNFAPTDPIDLGALVGVELDGVLTHYFVGPKSGGLEIEHQKMEILVITPQSPLGQNLMGKSQGQRWKSNLGNSQMSHHIVSVQ